MFFHISPARDVDKLLRASANETCEQPRAGKLGTGLPELASWRFPQALSTEAAICQNRNRLVRVIPPASFAGLAFRPKPRRSKSVDSVWRIEFSQLHVSLQQRVLLNPDSEFKFRRGQWPIGQKSVPRFCAYWNGERLDPPPIWIMRQAGRYLPEYRELRTRAKSFLDFCYSPALATEAVMQPLRRFPLDAAILFSDILVVPDALGRKVWFVEGEGPRLEPLIGEERWRFDDPGKALQRLAPVYEAVERIARGDPEGHRADRLLPADRGRLRLTCCRAAAARRIEARRAAYERPADVDALLDGAGRRQRRSIWRRR